MKVLMIGNHGTVHGGITSVIAQIMEHDWQKENIDIDFIPTFAGGGNLKKIVFFSISYIRIAWHCLMKKPDVVYMHMSHHGSFKRKYLVHKLCKAFRIPDVIHLHGSEFEKWYSEVDLKIQSQIQELLRGCSRFIVLGNKWNSIINSIEPETATTVVSNAVHIPEKTASWNSDRFTVLFLGVLVKRKGVHDLLKAVEQIKLHNQAEGLKVIVAGTGEEEEHLKKLAQQYEIEELVDFIGWTDGEKKQQLLETAQMLVLPSYNEGLPIAILEAISYGLPVVATNVGDVSAVVRSGENGFLIQPGDIEALAESIEKIKATERDYIAYSRKSRDIAEHECSDEVFFEALKECFTSILN